MANIRKAKRKGNSDFYQIKILKPMEKEDGTMVNVFVDDNTYSEAECDSELLGLQAQLSEIRERIDELNSIKSLIKPKEIKKQKER